MQFNPEFIKILIKSLEVLAIVFWKKEKSEQCPHFPLENRKERERFYE